MPHIPDTASIGEIVYTFFALVLVAASLVNGYIIWTRGRHSQVDVAGWAGAPVLLFWQKIALVFLFTFSGALFATLGIIAMGVPDNPAPSATVTRWVSAVGFTGMELSFTAFQVALLVMRPLIDRDLDTRQIIMTRYWALPDDGSLGYSGSGVMHDDS